jgi:hypothetical protein
VDFVRLDNQVEEPVPYTSQEGERCDGTACRAGLVCQQATVENDAGVVSLCVRAP